MPESNSSMPDGPHRYARVIFRDSSEIESLPSSARTAIWKLQGWLQSNTRVPIFAMVGQAGIDLRKAALALCEAGGGKYIRLSEFIRQKLIENPDFRAEWIDAGYLAKQVLDLATSCAESFMVVDDWEAVLSSVRHNNPKAHLEILDMLIFRSVGKPVVLVLPLSRGGFGSVAEVRGVMDSGGRSRVVALADESK